MMEKFNISFLFDGVHITNPTMSEDGRFSVSPKHYGFSIDGTGGGCSAWSKRLDDGKIIVLTNSEGLSHNLGDNFLMGLYDGSEDEGTWGNCLGTIEQREIV